MVFPRLRQYTKRDHRRRDPRGSSQSQRKSAKSYKRNEAGVVRRFAKKIDRFAKKQDILTPQAKSDLRADIQKGYDDLRKNGLDLDRTYADKLKGIIKSNSNENVK